MSASTPADRAKLEASFGLESTPASTPMKNDQDYEDLPDVRDGLNAKERIVLACISELQGMRNGRNVPTAMLYGRVLEHVDMSVDELQSILQRFVGVNGN